MIRRLRALLRKEALHERWSLAAIGTILLAVGLVRWLLTRSNDRAPSDMEGAGALISVFQPVAGLVLGHRLIVREYQAKSQLFLEALPLRRWEVALSKYAFGLLALSAFALASLGSFAIAANEHEPRFLLCAALRALGYTGACWSLFFAMGMLGRLRIPAYLTLLMALLAVRTSSSLELARFGPLALINSVSFSYERSHIPWGALLQTGLLSAGLAAIGFAVALVREGSIAEVLARRASAREVAGLLVLLCAELVCVGLLEGKRPHPPFEFTGKEVARSARANAAVMYALPELEPHGREALAVLERIDAHIHDQLGVQRTMPVRVAHSALLNPREVRGRDAGKDDALLFEVNLGAKNFDATDLAAHVMHGALFEASDHRALFEPNHWLLDGYSMYVAIDGEPRRCEREWLRAVVALHGSEVSESEVRAWEHLMERVGEMQANAVAFALVDFLAERHGKARTLGLARSVLARPTVTGVVSWFRLRNTLDRRFSAQMQESFPQFLDAFRKRLLEKSQQGTLRETLTRIPNDRVAVSLTPSAVGQDLKYVASGPSLERERVCVLKHGLLRPYDIYYSEQLLTLRDFRWPAGQARFEGTLHGEYAAGQRVFAAVDCEVPEFDASERLAVARLGGK